MSCGCRISNFGGELDASRCEAEKYKRAFENLVARIDRDGGHAQEGKSVEENLKRADEKVAALFVALDVAHSTMRDHDCHLESPEADRIVNEALRTR